VAQVIIFKYSDDVYYTQYYLVSGLHPSSLKNEHNVLGTGRVPVYWWKDGQKPRKLGPIEKAILNQWTLHICYPCMCI